MKSSKRLRPGARPAAWLIFTAGALLAGCSLRDGALARRSPGARPPAGSLLDPAGADAADAADANGLEWPTADLEPAPYDPSKFPSPPAPVAPPYGVGSSRGSFAVADDGAATYALPLHVAPGRAGIQPQLAISYNSSGGNGYLGVGMSIAGLSAVARCASNERDDGASRGPRLDEGDRFCLDGRRLVAVKGAYGADGAEYRTVPDSFAKVVSHGAPGYRGPRSFTVYDREGKIREYGTGAGAAVTAGDRVRQWSLSQVRDRSGNAMSYEYEAFSTTESTPYGELTYVVEQRPRHIRYTSHESGLPADRRVDFDYETDPRPDPLSGYGLGLRKGLAQRLRAVRSYGPGDQLAREYRLAYGRSEGTGRSVLEAVTECAADACQRPTRFTWASGYAGFVSYERLEPSAPPASPEQGVASLLPLDVDGDGREDLVYPDETGWNILFSRPDVAGRYPYTTVTRASAVNHGFHGQNKLWLKGLALDYDGDGL
ncbi:MAG TPA: SpvB/TcaC N-terminal domain-containing protein, partial [Polyangiaceae bacterium]|nr:SpvB/TcaC N-terminal domain-containing protein [Polyangiaceae bacterium]